MIRFKTALRTDERVRFMDEIISGMQVIKMFAWELPFSRLISEARHAELKEILKTAYIQAISITSVIITNRLALFCTIYAMIQLYGHGNVLVSKMFMISFLLNELAASLRLGFVLSLSNMTEAIVSFKRIQTFLEYDEREKLNRNIGSNQLESRGLAILMEGASAGWTPGSEMNKKKTSSYKCATNEKAGLPETSFTLQGIDLEVPKGKLVFVIGSVGAGKSTFIQTLLSELPLICGSIGVNGSISYASQESWIFASTIRQNIIFGQPMDKSRYEATLRCTALKADLAQFSSGDLTVVGENGTGLSGGQKARVNLARAVYRAADIYLIDDPLSAVDTHVQSHLFDACLGPKGFLARQNATRVLITHQLHFLQEADWIVVLKDVRIHISRNILIFQILPYEFDSYQQGMIEIQGDYSTVQRSGIDLVQMNGEIEPDQNIAEMISDVGDNSQLNSASKIESIPSTTTLNGKGSELGTIQQNEDQTGLLKTLEASSKQKIDGLMWANYFKAAEKPCTLAVLITAFLVTQILASGCDVWVSYW